MWRHLTLTDDQRLQLILPDELPVRAAARAIPGHSCVGRHQGAVVFTFPADPRTARLVATTFEPRVSATAQDAWGALLAQAAELEASAGHKAAVELPFDPGLRTAPMAHQIQAMAFCWARLRAGAGGAALLMEQGTGKTLCAVGLANGLRSSGLIDHVLVVAPNSLRGIWGSLEDGEVALHSAVAPQIGVLQGSREVRAEQIVESLDRTWPFWLIANYEMFAVDHRKAEWFPSLLRALPGRRGLLVLDESTMIKNPRAKRTRTLLALAEHYPYTLLLTGTPVTRSPLDVYSQFEAIAPACLGYRTYLAFERAHAQYARRHRGWRTYVEVVGYRNLDDLERRVAEHSYRARAAECLDLPPVTQQRVPVEMSPEQARTLKALRTDMMAEMEAGALVDGRSILTRYLRMAQIIGGWVGTLEEDGEAGLRAFTPNPKLDALMDFLGTALEDPTRKAVVFAMFVPEIRAIVQACKDRGWGVVPFYGAVPMAEREENRLAFRRNPDCRVFVAQYQTGSKGLNLTEASVVAFYSLTFNLEDFLQARKRVHRVGQTQHVTEAYLLAHTTHRGRTRETMDHVILRELQAKKSFADIVTGDRAREAMEAL